MKYEWEEGWFDNELVSGIGSAVMNRDSVEGALIFGESLLPPLGTVARADVLKDIMGDAIAAYDEAVEAMMSDGQT